MKTISRGPRALLKAEHNYAVERHELSITAKGLCIMVLITINAIIFSNYRICEVYSHGYLPDIRHPDCEFQALVKTTL